MTDADIEMAELEAMGNAIHSQRQRGVCCHQSAVGWIPEPCYPEQVGLKPGQLRCTDGCRQVFNSDDDWFDAMAEAVNA